MLVKIILISCVFSLLSSCYATKQALYQNDLFNRRVPIEEILKDSSLDEGLRGRLRFVERVKDFAQSSGLDVGQTYSYFIDNKQGAVSYLLFVSPSLDLSRKEWWFPFVGSVPYLGFFDRRERDSEAKAWEDQGFDVYRSGAAAFSSLGWFEDPVYRSMIDKESYADIARLLFHELSHRTFWLAGNVSINEAFADFVAEKLLDLFANKTPEIDMQKKKLEYEDQKLLEIWVEATKANLDKIYKNKDLSDEQKRIQKKEVLNLATTRDWPSFKAAGFQRLKEANWNNARLLSISLYRKDIQKWKAFYDRTQTASIKLFIENLKKLSSAEIHQQLEQL